MKRLLPLLLLLPLLAALPAAPGRAQDGGGQADVGLAQTSICWPVLADPEVSAPPETSPWRGYGVGWSFSTEPVRSSPQSLYLGASGAAVGQVITFTTSLTEVVGTLDYFYTPEAGASNDSLRVRLYTDGNISTSGLITTANLLTTGLITNSWATLEWEVTDLASISRLRALGRAALVFSAGPGTELWLDSLRAETCVPATGVSGVVTRDGAGLPGAEVLLARTDAAGATSVVESQWSGPGGTYSFSPLPLAAGESYRVWFLNHPQTPPSASGLLGFWAGPRIGTLTFGQYITNLNFNVAGVELLSPSSYGEVVVSDAQPAVLRWRGRSTVGEQHRVCIYDPQRADPSTELPLTYCSPAITSRPGEDLSFTLNPQSLPASFGFTYGRSYRWYVEVYDRNPNDSEAQYGYSFAERAIALLSAPRPAPPAAPPLEAGDPAAGVPNAEWTLLIYMAADNAIGDPSRVPSPGRPSGQLASLPELAAIYTRVNLVSHVDRYEPDGIELCSYPPGGAPDCRMRAEANTADPRTLAAFIADGRRRYPAERTALLIIAPGQAAGQLALDETAPGGPSMSLAGLDTAYQAAGLASAQLDLVIYQAPLLGSAEVLRATAPYARYMVASAGQVWQLGPYRQLVPVLGGPKRFDVAAVARDTVAAYATTVALVGGARATTWAAYDLGRAAALGESIDTLAEAIQAALSSEESVMRPALATARAGAQSYDSSGNGRHDALETLAGAPVALEEDSLVDLRDLAERVQGAVGAPAYVQEAAADLIDLLATPATSPVIASVIRSGQSIAADAVDLSRARGLSAFFPGGDRLGGGATLTESYHSADPPGGSVWADLLRAYRARVLAVGPGGVTQGAGGGAQFRPQPGGFVSTTLYMPVVRR